MFKTLREVWTKLDDNEKKYLRAGLQLILLVGAIAILILPLLFTLPSLFNWMDFSTKGPVGDTVNGIAGPFIAMLAAILTFLAFYIQYKANVQQRDHFTKELKRQRRANATQARTWQIERFENRYYELLKLHRANVEEMNIANKVHGRKCFVQMFYELKYCWIKVNDVIRATPKDIQDDYNYKKMNVFEFVYKIFFFGIGFNSEKQLMYSFNQPQRHLFHQCKPVLIEIQDRFEAMRLASPDESIYVLEVPVSGIADERTFEISYFPFDGHVNRLGHYYRHLFQTVTYITQQDEKLLNLDEKYSYVKTLRAQLSNHEQLLLYYNSLAWFDAEWREIFTKYRLIKNLPLPLANFGESPEQRYKAEIAELRAKGMEMFEWRE